MYPTQGLRTSTTLLFPWIAVLFRGVFALEKGDACLHLFSYLEAVFWILVSHPKPLLSRMFYSIPSVLISFYSQDISIKILYYSSYFSTEKKNG